LVTQPKPHCSKREFFIRELSDAVVSQKVYTDVHRLLCDDSEAELDEDDDEVVNTEIIAVMQYAAMLYFHYIYRETSYCTDVRRSNAMPEMKKTLMGYKYNEEELLWIFWVPRHLFLITCEATGKTSIFQLE
jgi:hypothetical protein